MNGHTTDPVERVIEYQALFTLQNRATENPGY